MAKKRTALARKRGIADQIVNRQVDQIDEALEKVERLLKGYEPIIEKRNQLRSARRALLGGSRITGGGGTTVRQEDVTNFLREHPGATSAEIAKGVGGTREQVSSHLYRGKGERFLRKGQKNYLREPKKGINTEEDIG